MFPCQIPTPLPGLPESSPLFHCPLCPRPATPFTLDSLASTSIPSPLRSAPLAAPRNARPRARRQGLRAAASHYAALTREGLSLDSEWGEAAACGCVFGSVGSEPVPSEEMGRRQQEGKRRGEKDGKRNGTGKAKAKAKAVAVVAEDAAPVTGCWIRFPRLRGCMSSRAKVDSSTTSGGGGGKKCSCFPLSFTVLARSLSFLASCCSRSVARASRRSILACLPVCTSASEFREKWWKHGLLLPISFWAEFMSMGLGADCMIGIGCVLVCTNVSGGWYNITVRS